MKKAKINIITPMKDPAVCIAACKNIKGILTRAPPPPKMEVSSCSSQQDIHTLWRGHQVGVGVGGAAMSGCFLQPQVGSCALQGVPRVAGGSKQPSESANCGETVSYQRTWRQKGDCLTPRLE